jgi:hypothetical protein
MGMIICSIEKRFRTITFRHHSENTTHNPTPLE